MVHTVFSAACARESVPSKGTAASKASGARIGANREARDIDPGTWRGWVDSRGRAAKTLPAGPAQPGRRTPTGESLFRDHHQDAAWRELDQRLRQRPAPPALDPAVEVLVADDDEVGVDLLRVAGDLVRGIPDHELAVRSAPGSVEARQPVFEDRFEGQALLLLELAVVHIALAADKGRGRRHHGDQVEVRLALLRDLAAVEQRLLSGLGAVVGEQDSLVHGRSPLCRRKFSPLRVCNKLFFVRTSRGVGRYRGKGGNGTRPGRPGLTLTSPEGGNHVEETPRNRSCSRGPRNGRGVDAGFRRRPGPGRPAGRRHGRGDRPQRRRARWRCGRRRAGSTGRLEHRGERRLLRPRLLQRRLLQRRLLRRAGLLRAPGGVRTLGGLPLVAALRARLFLSSRRSLRLRRAGWARLPPREPRLASLEPAPQSPQGHDPRASGDRLFYRVIT